jgi:outer membrane receptor protein involved in Fe transport
VKKLLLLCSTAAAFVPTAAFAQSTGTQETEKDTIVVTGTRSQPGTAGVVVQDSTKAKGLITQELISKGNPGQSILNSINIIPGVNFTQSDPYGSSGGNIRIRGFDGNRISLTLRRPAAERHRQLRDLLEPAARSRADRAGQRQPRRDRRRQPDRFGGRRHRQPAHRASDP